MVKLGHLTGFELPAGPYIFRRGNSEALDSSSKLYRPLLNISLISIGFISDSQRNLILQHKHNSDISVKRYISRCITVDTQAAYRGLEPQSALMPAASGISRTIDRRRLWKLKRA